MERELCWIDKKQLDALVGLGVAERNLVSTDILPGASNKIIKEAADSLLASVEFVDELHPGILRRYKQKHQELCDALEAAYDAYDSKINDLIQKHEEAIKEAHSKISKYYERFSQIKKTVEDYNSAVGALSFYNIERFFDLVNRIADLPEEKQKLIQRVFSNK